MAGALRTNRASTDRPFPAMPEVSEFEFRRAFMDKLPDLHQLSAHGRFWRLASGYGLEKDLHLPVNAILPTWELSVPHCLTTIGLLTSEAPTGVFLNRGLTTRKRCGGLLNGTNGGL